MRTVKGVFKRLAYPFYWPFIDTPWDRKVIFGFTRWFGSVTGFKQQVLLIVGWTVLDIIFPSLDPKMLTLLVFLTVYSGGTQPGLAIGNEQSMKMLVQLMKNNIDQLKAQAVVMHELRGVVEELRSMQRADREILDDIVEELTENGDVTVRMETESERNARNAAKRRGE